MIYKYYGTNSATESIKILDSFFQGGTIKASNPRTFNDPSEFKLVYDFDAPPEIIEKRYFLDNPNSSRLDFENWLGTLNDHRKRYIGYQNRQQNLDSFGVICLTCDPEHYLLWSHYARSHTGFCIGFDEKILESVNDIACTGWVNYSDKVPVFNYYTQGPHDFVKAVFFNKSICWEYEAEVRIVTNGFGSKIFDRSLVTEITIGCKAPSELDSYVRNLIDTDVGVCHMLDLSDKYQLKKEKIRHNHYVQKCAL